MPGFVNDIELNGNDLHAVGGVERAVSVIADAGATEQLDTADFSIFDVTVTEDCTFSFGTLPATGTYFEWLLYLRQDATGGWTSTWPAAVRWPGGAPTLDETASGLVVIAFSTLDGGTNVEANVIGEVWS